MKKIGKEVLYLHTKTGNPRNGEGAMIRLKSGEILFAFTEYYGDSDEDHATARISYCISADEGESFSEPRVLIEKGEGQLNVMSVSLVRCADGALGILYLEKRIGAGGGQICMPIFRRSLDEGKSFGEPIDCMKEPGYYVVNNDRILCLRSGRLIFPAAFRGEYDPKESKKYASSTVFAYSDDHGLTWDKLPSELFFPYRDNTGLQEPGLYEYEDGTLWTWSRTGWGHQYQAFSQDGGRTWSQVEPNLYFTSPDSPMQVKRLKDCSVAIFNPYGFHCLMTKFETWGVPKRTPFVCAVSRDDGKSFQPNGKSCRSGGLNDFSKRCFLLEDDEENSYCYPAVLEVSDGFLVAYYHSENTESCLKAQKILTVHTEEIEDCL